MVDWWGVGILLYELVVGNAPFNDRFTSRTMDAIVNREYEKKDYFSKQFNDLLSGLLEKSPKLRLGCTAKGGTENIKKHPFFKDIDW